MTCLKYRYFVLRAFGALSVLVPVFFFLFLNPFIIQTPRAQALPSCNLTVTNTNDSGGGSLRDALTQANANPDTSNVCFAIPGAGVHTITPTSALPPVIRPAVIDATTQTGFAGTPLIEINGAGAGSTPGIFLTASGNSRVTGLIINRFAADGIFIDSPGNIVVGNYIGTDASGTAVLGNGTSGVGIFNASGNTVGGTTPAERNLISGNTGNGVAITDTSGTTAQNNVVRGNYIGTNSAGTGSVANGADGILINNAPNNTVGGTTSTTPDGACTGACNLVSGNGYNGIGVWYQSAVGNQILGNYVGTNAAGTAAVANFNIGVELNESPNNTVGGTTAAARNIMSGNGGAGMLLTGAAATGNQVTGNYIGTNAAGTAAVANQKMGIGIAYSPGISSASSNNIGGTTGVTPGGACTGGCNLISGNHDDGIFITKNSGGGGNLIKSNYIGTNAAGTGAIGNGANGIGILEVANNQIGGGTNEERNVISGNGDNGVIVAGWGSTGNRITGNFVGMGSNGGNLGNTRFGVEVTTGTDTAILGNSIYANGQLGIDLGYNYVTHNDQNDWDGGANRSQNFPEVFAETVNGATKAYSSINSTPNTSFRIEFFSCEYCNAGPPNNFGEGQTYLGGTTVTTDVFGNVNFTWDSPSMVPGGRFITATATKMIGSTPADTSEFSECTQVNASKPGVFSGSLWFLRNNMVPAAADNYFNYGFPAQTLACAWDASQPGLKLPVIMSNGIWFMRASQTNGIADRVFSYGPQGSTAVCGDWDGDGVDSIGVMDGASNWYLRNSNGGGPPDITFQYGPYGATPTVGDWNGDGTDTTGVFVNGSWILRNANSGGAPDLAFNYGFNARVVPGDWDGNGTDTPGLVVGNTWLLRNSNDSGVANFVFNFGFPGATAFAWK